MKRLLTFILLTFFIVGAVSAEEIDDPRAAFRSFYQITPVDIKVPAVVDLPLEEPYPVRRVFLLYDVTSETWEPWYLHNIQEVARTPLRVVSESDRGNGRDLIDENVDTMFEYDLPEEGIGEAVLTIIPERPIYVDAITINVANNVALPRYATVNGVVDDERRTLLGRTVLEDSTITFPESRVSTLELILEYGQPLHLVELRVHETAAETRESLSVRYLAQPEHSYELYLNPDRYVSVHTSESSDLRSGTDVIELGRVPLASNPVYVPADLDGDEVPDERDNCVSIRNRNQEDANNNGRGDVCDDNDRDGIIHAEDNCPQKQNPGQVDEDGDGVGDACDDAESPLTDENTWLLWFTLVAVVTVIGIMFYRTTGAVQN